MTIKFSGGCARPHLDLPSALSKIGDGSVVRDLLGMLVWDVPKIQRALLDQKTTLAARLVHSLKGCLPIFCHAPICDLVAQAQQYTQHGDLALTDEVCASLRPALAALALEIQHHSATPVR